jgi:protein ImuA
LEQKRNNSSKIMHAAPVLTLVSGGKTDACRRLSAVCPPAAESQSSRIPEAKRTLVEIFAEGAGRDAAAAGFVASRLAQGKTPVLWVQDRLAMRETGRPFVHGLQEAPNIIHAAARDAAGVLWTMEEGLKCRALSAVVGEIWGDPAALDFTATRRLALRAEAHGVSAFLLRFAAHPNLSAARQRWRGGSAPSAPPPGGARAPGEPRWSLDLFRARGSRPGQWIAGHDAAAHRLPLAAALPDRAVGEAGESQRRGFG